MDSDSFLGACFGLRGKTALVTGAARGLGREIARYLGLAGAVVVINDLDPDAATATATALAAEGIEATGLAFDVADGDAVAGAAAHLASRGLVVDILVSNAGNQNRKPLTEMSPSEWQSLQAVHVNGAFHCVRAFVPGMLSKGGGTVILMSSVAGQAAMPNIGAYATAKGGVAALARAVAVEFGGRGITCNALAPGFVRTDFTTGLQQNPAFETFLQQAVPVGRWADAAEVASVALFLAGPGSRFVNGQVLAIDGGLLARM